MSASDEQVMPLSRILVLIIFTAVAMPWHLTPAWGSSSRLDTRPRIVAFGDSLTAGLGVPAEESYPAQLQRSLDALGYVYRVVNAGVSGDTTAGGLRRVPWILTNNPDVVILELGANDGLRGLSIEQTQHNLREIIQRLKEAGVGIILAGMKLPPNYGQDYLARFEGIYPSLAAEYRIPLIPFFLEGVGGSRSLNQNRYSRSSARYSNRRCANSETERATASGQAFPIHE
jgi:acyl-CoA thioesterase-1